MGATVRVAANCCVVGGFPNPFCIILPISAQVQEDLQGPSDVRDVIYQQSIGPAVC